MMVHAEVTDSKAIAELVFDSYNRETLGKLTVVFTTGAQYEYRGVEYSDFIDLLGAESIGAHFAKTFIHEHPNVAKI